MSAITPLVVAAASFGCLPASFASPVQTSKTSCGSYIGIQGASRASLVKILREDLAPMIEGADWGALLSRVNALNENQAGAFQVASFNGEGYLTYVIGGRSSFAGKDVNGKWDFHDGPNEAEKEIVEHGLDPEMLAKRFKLPVGTVLVGFETNVFGSIIPMFSPSAELTFFRDISDNGFTFLANAQSATDRIAKIIPLVKLKVVGTVADSVKNLGELPPEIQDLLRMDLTLTTKFSVPFTDELFVLPDPTPYAVLMIADQYKFGRTGVVLKDGVPMLKRERGQEYFLEIKGVGLGSPLPSNENVVHQRGSEGNVRSGRMPLDYAESELVGSDLTERNMLVGEDIKRLYSRSVVGVILPEYESFDNYDGTCLRNQSSVTAALADGCLSAQVYRLSTSTRRLAFADNPAFGDRLPARPALLDAARTYYGKMFADLLIRASEPAGHTSAHAENFVNYPVHKVITHTDYADIEVGYKDASFLSEVEEYGIFTGSGQRQNVEEFFGGLRASLEPRNLWTAELANLLKGRPSKAEFTNFMHYNYLIPLKLQNALTYRRQNRDAAPKYNWRTATQAENKAWIEFQNSSSLDLPVVPKHADAALKSMLEHQRTDVDALRAQFHTLEQANLSALNYVEQGLISGTIGRRYFSQHGQVLERIAQRLRRLHNIISDYIRNEEAAGWSGSLDEYASVVRAQIKMQASIYDDLWAIFGG